MSTAKKVAVCSTLAAILGFLGTISTSLCAGLPVTYQGICVLGGRAAVEGSNVIKANTPVAMPDGGFESR